MAKAQRAQPEKVELALPRWVAELIAARPARFATREERMQLAIDLAERNVRSGTGGPFGAALFHAASGELLSAGVNVVIASRCAMAHAELMALALAQQGSGTHDLSQRCGRELELATSAEPCGMCLGAALWSGVGSIVCGAAREDVEALGFDEGLRNADWEAELAARGVQVVREVLRIPARRVLESYVRGGGLVYNAELIQRAKSAQS